MKKAISIIAYLLTLAVVVFLLVFLNSRGLGTGERVKRKKTEYQYDQWKDAAKIKGMELLFLDGYDEKAGYYKDVDGFNHWWIYDSQAQASLGVLDNIVGVAERPRPPEVKNWWAAAGLGDFCMIQFPSRWHPAYSRESRENEDPGYYPVNDVLILPLEEHYTVLYCKMGNLLVCPRHSKTLKDEWDAVRRFDKIFYEPVPLSSSIPELSWSLNQWPFSGWYLTLDKVPKGSFYFLQGTGLALKRVGGGDREVISPGGMDVVYDPYRSAEIRLKKGEQKPELLLSVVGPDLQKRTVRVDLDKSTVDTDWLMPRLTGLFLVLLSINAGSLCLWWFWRRRQKAKANPATPEPQAQP